MDVEPTPVVIVGNLLLAEWLRSNPMGDITDARVPSAALISETRAMRWPLVADPATP